MWTRAAFQQRLNPPLIGMVHLPPLPGAPDHAGGMGAVVEAAVADLDALYRGGIRAAMVENFHDSPFWPEQVPPETVAALAVVVAELRRRRPDMLLGVNVLRNDAAAALGIAAATGAAYIRVNVHAGAMVTDQGPLAGQAHRTVRKRRELQLEAVGILADLRVKHAAPLAARDLVAEAADLRGRARADAIVVSGEATGAPVDLAALASLRAAMPDCPLVVGSGVTAASLPELLRHADAAIVGTSLQHGGRIAVDRVVTLVAALARDRAGDLGKDPA